MAGMHSMRHCSASELLIICDLYVGDSSTGKKVLRHSNDQKQKWVAFIEECRAPGAAMTWVQVAVAVKGEFNEEVKPNTLSTRYYKWRAQSRMKAVNVV